MTRLDRLARSRPLEHAGDDHRQGAGFRSLNDTSTAHEQLEAIKRLNAGKETQGEIARSLPLDNFEISKLT